MKDPNQNYFFPKSQSQKNSIGKNKHCRNCNSKDNEDSNISSFWKSNTTRNSLKNTKTSSPVKINLNDQNNPQIKFQDYIYDKSDSFEDLIKKNEKLRLLIVQANNKINDLIQKQKENESDYNLEKKSILQQLEKIQKNYKIYANSHKAYKEIKVKLEKLIVNYNILNENYFNAKNECDSLLKDYYSIYEEITSFIETNYEKNNIHQFSFEFILHLKKYIYENYKSLTTKNSPSSSIQIDKIVKQKSNTPNKTNLNSIKIPNRNYKKNQNDIQINNERKKVRSKSPSQGQLYQKKVIRNNSNSSINLKNEENNSETNDNHEKNYSIFNSFF